MASAFDGIRIVELAQGVAGPYTGMLLAEQGATVIKIEPPQGDKARGTPGFHIWNRSKQSIIADSTTREGQTLIQQLVETADVLLFDATPDEQVKLGLTQEMLTQHYPRLVA